MTKFDKLTEVFNAWYTSPASTCSSTYDAMLAYIRELFPGDVPAGIDLNWCYPGCMRGYVNRRDYLGRLVQISVNLTPTGPQVRIDPMTRRVNNRMAKHFEVLYEQV